jgi:hypothetical protein
MTPSASLGFFAAERDQRAILSYLFAETDVRVFESSSQFDTGLREFRSGEEVAEAFALGTDEVGNGHAVLLQVWSPSVMRALEIERIALQPDVCDGHTFRYAIQGAGLIQLYFGGLHRNVITMSRLGHQSQVRAATWGRDGEVNWEALKKLSGKIRYHIAKRLGVGKVPGHPVLSHAMELVKLGYEMKFAAQTPWRFELS